MRFIKTTKTGGGRCNIVQISTYANQVNQVARTQHFTRDQFEQAIIAVETAERRMGMLPNTLNGMSVSDVRRRLHQTYYFSKAVVGNVYRPSILASQWAYEKAKMQQLELQQALGDINEDLANRGKGISSTKRNQLQSLQRTVNSLNNQLLLKLRSFYQLSDSSLQSLHTVYGAAKAPGYYHRQHRKILADETFKVCKGRTVSGGNSEVEEGLTLAQCGKACALYKQKQGCRVYTFQLRSATTGRCTLFGDLSCTQRSQADSASTLVLTERATCTSSQLSATGCDVRAFVD